jgi:hypothetical protein
MAETELKEPCKKPSNRNTFKIRRWEQHHLWKKECWTCKLIDVKMFRCVGCNMIKYCSKICQKKDWLRHKPECRDVHGVCWILKNFATNERNFLLAGLTGEVLMDEESKQLLRENKDLRCCASTSQVLARLLTDFKSGYYFAYNNMALYHNTKPADDITTFNHMFLLYPFYLWETAKVRAYIYSCIVTAVTKDGDFYHYFTLTQHTASDKDSSFVLWQAYSKGPDQLVYSLDNWFDLTFKLEVDPSLRCSMNSNILVEKFLTPFNDLLRGKNMACNWKKLFGSVEFSECERVDLHFIMGYSYLYPGYLRKKKQS